MRAMILLSLLALACAPNGRRVIDADTKGGGTGFVGNDGGPGFSPDDGGDPGGEADVVEPSDDAGSDGTDGVEGTDKPSPDTTDPPPPQDNDQDGVDDKIDNCFGKANPTQADLDGDGLGDACDPDIDGDGVFNPSDCAPEDPAVFPGGPEICDGVDNNCDDVIDGPGSQGCTDLYLDTDGDGAGQSGSKTCLCTPEVANQVHYGGDCDDGNPNLGPWTPEVCDGFDNNCNLLVDEGCDDDQDGYCDASMQVVGVPAVCPNGPGDCFDWSPLVSPAAAEIPGDGLDNDCDGTMLGEPTGGSLVPDCTGKPCVGQAPLADVITCGLDLCYPTMPDTVQSVTVSSPSGVSGSSLDSAWHVVAHYGHTTNDLAPYGGNSYVLLGTGPVLGTSHSASLFGSSIPDPYSSDGYDTNDNMEITLVLKAPPGVTGFSIDYIYMSEEYEEYIGSSFNDKFYILLNAPQTTGGQTTVINYTHCSNPSSYFDFQEGGNKWCYIAINTAFSEPCPNAPTSIAGTGFECASSSGIDSSSYGSSTGWLQTSWPIQAGEVFTLTFHIHDTTDHIYDSLVILDNFRWEGGTFTQGTASHN